MKKLIMAPCGKTMLIKTRKEALNAEGKTVAILTANKSLIAQDYSDTEDVFTHRTFKAGYDNYLIDDAQHATLKAAWFKRLTSDPSINVEGYTGLPKRSNYAEQFKYRQYWDQVDVSMTLEKAVEVGFLSWIQTIPTIENVTDPAPYIEVIRSKNPGKGIIIIAPKNEKAEKIAIEVGGHVHISNNELVDPIGFLAAGNILVTSNLLSEGTYFRNLGGMIDMRASKSAAYWYSRYSRLYHCPGAYYVDLGGNLDRYKQYISTPEVAAGELGVEPGATRPSKQKDKGNISKLPVGKLRCYTVKFKGLDYNVSYFKDAAEFEIHNTPIYSCVCHENNIDYYQITQLGRGAGFFGNWKRIECPSLAHTVDAYEWANIEATSRQKSWWVNVGGEVNNSLKRGQFNLLPMFHNSNNR